MNNYVEFTKAAKQLIQQGGINNLPQGVDRDVALAVFVGRAIATRLPMPTSPVLSVQNYYNAHCLETVMQLVSALNEAVVLDTALMADTIAQLFKLRYDIVYNPATFVMYTDLIATSIAGSVPDRIAAALTVLKQEERFNQLFMTKFMSNGIDEVFDRAQGIVDPVSVNRSSL